MMLKRRVTSLKAGTPFKVDCCGLSPIVSVFKLAIFFLLGN